MPHSAASDLGLHCLPVTLLGVSRLQWVNYIGKFTAESFRCVFTNTVEILHTCTLIISIDIIKTRFLVKICLFQFIKNIMLFIVVFSCQL